MKVAKDSQVSTFKTHELLFEFQYLFSVGKQA